MSAQFGAPPLLPTADMTLWTRFAQFMTARLGHTFGHLQAWLARWLPQPGPALVPIPLRAERVPRRAGARRLRER
ncbi:MAG: hypothetical protein RIQ53_3575 [Pseudomonadota bacterium]|jgi:hypothetical protein